MELYWVDERCVPPDHPDSNYRMTREAMLSKVPLKPEQVFRIEGEFEPDEAALAVRERRFARNFGWKARRRLVSMCLHWAWGTTDIRRRCFRTPTAFTSWCGLPLRITYRSRRRSWRVTLTWPVIVEAADVFFLIGGKDKADPLHRVLQGPYDPETLPSQLIQPKNGRLLYLLDRDAAALLPPPDTNGVGRLEIER